MIDSLLEYDDYLTSKEITAKKEALYGATA